MSGSPGPADDLNGILGVLAGERVLWSTALLAAGIVATGLLVGRFAPTRRRLLRRPSLYLAIYVTLLLTGAALRLGGGSATAEKVFSFATLFLHLGFVEIVAIAIFFVALARVAAALPNIARDLIVAVAYAGALILLLHRFGFEVPSLVAASGIVTLVISLSMQSTFSNVIGGVALQFDGSIHEGDWVQLADGTQGRVRQIRWRHTLVETRNWDTVVVPNASLLNQNILVLGKREDEPRQHRMWVYFQVDFRTAPERVIEVVSAALAQPIENVAASPAPNVICMDLAALDRNGVAYYAVRYWLTNLAVDDPTSSAVRARVFAALARAGIPLAVPPVAVSVAQNDEAAEQRRRDAEIDSRSRHLAQIPLFGALTDEERRRVASRLRPAPFCRGEVMTRQGAEAHYLYILFEGAAEVRVRRSDGDDVEVAEITAPNIFGEMGMLTGAPRTATVIAKTAVECFRLEKHDFQDVVRQRPSVAEEMSLVLAERKVRLERIRDRAEHRAAVVAEHSRIADAVRAFFGVSG